MPPSPSQAVTYAEVRAWARWLQAFTARDLASALHCSLPVAERGVKALLWNKVCLDTGDTLPGPDGPEALIEYVPIPPGPREHPTETPPEIVVAREAGGDPLRQPRGMPVGAQRLGMHSVTGQRRPGRRFQGVPKHVREAAKRAKGKGVTG